MDWDGPNSFNLGGDLNANRATTVTEDDGGMEFDMVVEGGREKEEEDLAASPTEPGVSVPTSPAAAEDSNEAHG